MIQLLMASRSAETLSHWHALFENFNTSGLEFYASVEKEIAARQLPDVLCSRVEWSESGVLSSRREYLRVRRGKLTFDVCAASYGTGFFFSWWMARQPLKNALAFGCLFAVLFFVVDVTVIEYLGIVTGLALGLALLVITIAMLRSSAPELVEDAILALPVVGALYERFVKPTTYYSMDTAIMFQESVHHAVMSAIEALRTQHGLRILAPEDMRPQSGAIVSGLGR